MGKAPTVVPGATASEEDGGPRAVHSLDMRAASLVAALTCALALPARAQDVEARGSAPHLRRSTRVRGPLTEAAASAALDRVRRRVRRCVRARPPASVRTSGPAAFRLLVEEGRVVSVAVAEAGWANEALRRCISRALMNARFAEAASPSRVDVSYRLGGSSVAALGALRRAAPEPSGGFGRVSGGIGTPGGRGSERSGRAHAPPGTGERRASGRVAGRPIVRGALSRGVIQTVVRRHLPAVRQCYERELASSPELAGRVRVRFVVDANGRVASARVDQDTLRRPALERCLVRQVRRWRFPAPRGGGIAVVTYPFVFRPRDAATARPEDADETADPPEPGEAGDPEPGDPEPGEAGGAGAPEAGAPEAGEAEASDLGAAAVKSAAGRGAARSGPSSEPGR